MMLVRILQQTKTQQYRECINIYNDLSLYYTYYCFYLLTEFLELSTFTFNITRLSAPGTEFALLRGSAIIWTFLFDGFTSRCLAIEFSRIIYIVGSVRISVLLTWGRAK